MKLTANCKNFRKAIHFVDRIVAKNLSLPILNNILLKTENGRLKIIATNLEIGITCVIGSKIEETGEITVPGKIISDFISAVSDESITLATKNNILQINSKMFKTNILGSSTEEYPFIPKIKDNYICRIPVQMLRTVLAMTVDVVATSETRPELAGLYVSFMEDEIVFAATDSFRLVEKKIKIKTQGKESVIIPRNTITEILRISGDIDGDMEIRIKDNQIMFVHEDVEIVSRLIDGAYPDYKRVIPEKIITKTLVRKNDIEKTIRLTALFSSTISDIKLQSKENTLTASARNSDKGDSTATVEAVIKDEPFDMSLNFNYFLDGLKIISSEKIIIEFTGEGSPLVLRPNDDRKDMLYLIMPLKN